MPSYDNPELKIPSYHVCQPKVDGVPQLPFRMLCVAQSQSGKTTTILNLLTGPYKNCFARTWVFSHSAKVDDSWLPFKKLCEEKDWDPEEHLIDHFDPAKLKEILDTQRKLIEFQKAHKHKHLHSICIILDDLLDNHHAMRDSREVEMLFSRGRHINASCICSVQKYRSLNNVVRMNSSDDLIWRLKNRADLDAVLDENSALVDKKTLEKLYRVATEQPFEFLHINKRASTVDEMFTKSFKYRLKIKSTE
jgi:hypothetical protein